MWENGECITVYEHAFTWRDSRAWMAGHSTAGVGDGRRKTEDEGWHEPVYIQDMSHLMIDEPRMMTRHLARIKRQRPGYHRSKYQ